MGARGPKSISAEKAWIKLKSEITISTETGCWLLSRGQSIGIGYKSVRANGFTWYAHQLAYFMEHKQLPFGIVIRHSCDTPNCINPAHLLGGTHADNVHDKVSKNRDQFGSKHYKAKLTEEDVRSIRKSTETYAELGRRYGISRGGIHNIKSGRSWSRVK